MTFIFPSINPSSRVILGKQRGNNALATTKNAMPAKFYPSDNTNHFSLNRFSNKKHTLSDTTYTDTSSYIQKKKHRQLVYKVHTLVILHTKVMFKMTENKLLDEFVLVVLLYPLKKETNIYYKSIV